MVSTCGKKRGNARGNSCRNVVYLHAMGTEDLFENGCSQYYMQPFQRVKNPDSLAAACRQASSRPMNKTTEQANGQQDDSSSNMF